jgi:hypothetical protein
MRLEGFRTEVCRAWRHALLRRSQATGYAESASFASAVSTSTVSSTTPPASAHWPLSAAHPWRGPAGLICALVLPEHAGFGEQRQAAFQLPDLIRVRAGRVPPALRGGPYNRENNRFAVRSP